MVTALDPDFERALDEAHSYVRHNARSTSVDAADAALPKSGTQRRKVYDFIAEQGERGATDAEIIAGLDMAHQSVGPRRLELLEAGLIRDSIQRRLTPTGQPAIVWVTTDRSTNHPAYGHAFADHEVA